MSTLRALSTRAHAALILPCLAALSACGGGAEPVQNNVSEPANMQENAVNAAAAPVTNETSNQAAATPAPAAEAPDAAAAKPVAETDAPKETAAAAPASAAPASEGDAANGAKLFAQCRVCHSVEPDKNGLGPSLHGVVGRKAGTLAGFNYSPAMKGSGITWSASVLNTYLRSPMKSIPGTKMAFAGIADDAKRADVIAYLQTLK